MAKKGLDERHGTMKRAKGWMGVLVALGLSLGHVSAVWADTEVVEGVTWYYDIDEETGTATVRNETPGNGDIVMPEILGGIP